MMSTGWLVGVKGVGGGDGHGLGRASDQAIEAHFGVDDRTRGPKDGGVFDGEQVLLQLCEIALQADGFLLPSGAALALGAAAFLQERVALPKLLDGRITDQDFVLCVLQLLLISGDCSSLLLQLVLQRFDHACQRQIVCRHGPSQTDFQGTAPLCGQNVRRNGELEPWVVACEQQHQN